jgi:hypothetical protein
MAEGDKGAGAGRRSSRRSVRRASMPTMADAANRFQQTHRFH